jgi:hypothetical protein
MTPFNCGNLNLGLLERWPNAGFGATCELICQREGGEWRRVAPGVPFLDVGPEGAFDRVLIYPTHNPPIRIGDRLFIFYTGGGARKNPNQGIPMAIGVATIGVDRFAGLACWRGKPEGRVVTKPLVATRPQLEVNIESLELKPIRIALASEDGAVIPGYDFADSQIEVGPSSIYTPVRWKERADLSELRGRKIRLMFEISGGILYGFRLVGEGDAT